MGHLTGTAGCGVLTGSLGSSAGRGRSRGIGFITGILRSGFNGHSGIGRRIGQGTCPLASQLIIFN